MFSTMAVLLLSYLRYLYSSYTYFDKFITKYVTLFDGIMMGIIFISFLDYSLLVCRNLNEICVFWYLIYFIFFRI